MVPFPEENNDHTRELGQWEAAYSSQLTVEPQGRSPRSTGRKFLYAYLKANLKSSVKIANRWPIR